jgi:hypothetical protein
MFLTQKTFTENSNCWQYMLLPARSTSNILY